MSPWQYKDLNDGNPMDSWVAYSDTLFPNRFNEITGSVVVQPDIIEILTWNDYCESHYIRDLPSQDDETATDYVKLGPMGSYVWGQEHSAWRIMAKYYISWWKTGSPPAITEDQVIFWHRVHPKGSLCIGGSLSPIRNKWYVEDAVFAWALVSEAATISMSLGSNQYWTFPANSSGPSMSMIPFPDDIPGGGGIAAEVAIMRDGQVVQFGSSSHNISTDCAYQNFNPVVNLAGPNTVMSIS